MLVYGYKKDPQYSAMIDKISGTVVAHRGDELIVAVGDIDVVVLAAGVVAQPGREYRCVSTGCGMQKQAHSSTPLILLQSDRSWSH